MSGHNALNLIDIEPGTRLRTNEGAIVELIENPRDGVWLICRYVEHPSEPGLVGDAEQTVFAQDIVGLAEAGQPGEET
ncbi:hypothetical protein [Pigmentiphaga sp.]|uniref:hypothetical protein n=1 Tax=Pigmentiphaga sp. TaxID=1977564 RepID=UPI00128B381B|nr:hypothetical protein [Pigmentiphaga sp.]MPS26449.1 hypothetical protein [Alcaligenaceae bacterium SAGV5]MPS52258.1 hypothetical protein [Alcaligenaceae bacterium SAGV3]MPT58031.1 hypothetical protein [Alcaligenaceae bacterium]